MAFNLLIVDDSNSMRTVVKKIVGLTGLEVNQILEADNGRKALDVLGGSQRHRWLAIVGTRIDAPRVEPEPVEVIRDVVVELNLPDVGRSRVPDQRPAALQLVAPPRSLVSIRRVVSQQLHGGSHQVAR